MGKAKRYFLHKKHTRTVTCIMMSAQWGCLWRYKAEAPPVPINSIGGAFSYFLGEKVTSCTKIYINKKLPCLYLSIYKSGVAGSILDSSL